MSNTQIAIDLLNIAGFRKWDNAPYMNYSATYYKSFGEGQRLELLFFEGYPTRVNVINSNETLAGELSLDYKPSMELLSGIYQTYAGQPLEWDIKKVWRKELEAMGFAGTDDNNSYQRMFKVGKKADFDFYITEDEDKRFVYEAKLPGVHQEDCEIAGVNTPDHVRKFLDAVGEL